MNAVENCIYLVATKCFITKNFLRLFHILMQPFAMIEGSDFGARGKMKSTVQMYANSSNERQRWRYGEWTSDEKKNAERMQMEIEIQENQVIFQLFFMEK